jgi:hypothetical protein
VGVTDTLDGALDRLLREPATRARWCAGAAVFDLTSDDHDALRTIDPGELDAMAAAVRAGVWSTAHRGSGTLAERFPGCVAAWRATHGADDDALVTAFVASEVFATYREVPAGVAGLSLEAAFFAWCESAEVGDAALREAEFLAAMARALASCAAPSFVVPAAFFAVPGGWCALSDTTPPGLYAAVGERVLSGPVTPFVAALLRRPAEREAVAAEFGVGAEALRETETMLVGLGLATRE